jgi:hypothetical protein
MPLFVGIRMETCEQEREKEYFMLLSLRKFFVLVILALALLAGLFGWTVRMMAPTTPYHTGMHSSHLVAVGPLWYCPPPPRNC